MCGVCASAAGDVDRARDAVARMNAAQRHRGPDGTALYGSGSTFLGNTRLAIIEPGSIGNQPLQAPDGSCTAVFNGEIYNYQALTHEYGLVPGGSDGSVIPQLYARFGTRSFGLLRGMFAVILQDHRRGHLVLVRDQLGIKPLHYRVCGDQLLVSSEVRPLRRPDDDLDMGAIARFLHLGALSGSETPFRGIQAVPPNTWLSFQGTDLRQTGQVEVDLDLSGSVAANVRDALQETVALHLRSDVPTALLLSSGIDSSAIAWAARRAGETLHCLTVEMGGGRTEGDAAAKTAASFGHSHEVVSSEVTVDDVADFFRAMQRPSVDGLNTFVVSRAVKSAGYKVALSGLGGDEAVGGYSHFRYLRYLRGLNSLDAAGPARSAVLLAMAAMRGRLPRKAHELVRPDGPRDAWQLSVLQRRVLERTTVTQALGLPDNEDLVRDTPVGVGRTDSQALTAAEYRVYLQSTLLPDADAHSMAASVELRVPLVDLRFLRAALSAHSPGKAAKVHFAQKLGHPRLRRLAAEPKQGFSLPIDAWMRRGLLHEHRRAVEGSDAPLWRYVDREVALPVLRDWEAGRRPWSHAWTLVAFDQWLRSLP